MKGPMQNQSVNTGKRSPQSFRSVELVWTFFERARTFSESTHNAIQNKKIVTR